MPKEGQSKGWTRGSDCCGWVDVETRKPGYALLRRRKGRGWMQRGEAEPCVSAFIGEVMEKQGNRGEVRIAAAGIEETVV